MPRPCDAEIGNGSPRAKPEELAAADVTAGVVGLVGGHEHRLAGRAQARRHRDVDRRQARGHIDHEQQRGGLVDGSQRLAVDARADDLALGVGIEAAGVDDAQAMPEVVEVAVAAIAREAGGVVHDRRPAADEAVEQRRLADVGAPDDGEQRRVGGRSRAGPPHERLRGPRCSEPASALGPSW
jgi:hypothetical protein